MNNAVELKVEKMLDVVNKLINNGVKFSDIVKRLEKENVPTQTIALIATKYLCH